MTHVSTFEEVYPIIAQAATSTAQAHWLDDLEAGLRRVQARLDGMSKTASEMVAVAEKSSSADANDLEATIHIVEELERSLGADLDRFRSEQEHWANLVHRHTRKDRLRFLTLISRQEEAMTRTAEAIRDARWRLLALQARIDEEGSAPIFDDPEALERFLEKG